MVLHLHQASSASCPQLQLFMDTQGRAKPAQLFPPCILQHLQRRGFCQVQTSVVAENPQCAGSPSPLQGAASLGGLKPTACRTPPIHPPIPMAESFDKDYPGTSTGAAGFSLSSSTPIPLRVLADADSLWRAGMSSL